MRKLTKKALSLVLCLLLVVSALSGALSISAETVVNDAPLNLDFSDGLNHWINTDNVEVVDGGFIFAEGRAIWSYLTTEEFKIPNLQVGDEVTVSIAISADAEKAAEDEGERIRLYVDTYLSDGTKYEGNIKSFNSAITSTVYTKTIIAEDVDQSFKLRIAMANGAAGAYTFSDIKVVVAKDTGAKYTYTNGATAKESYLNLDFSDGLNGWKNTENVAVNNGAVTFTEGRANWSYVQTDDFKIPNLAIGDTVTFSRVVTVINPEVLKTAKYTNVFRTVFTTSGDDWFQKDTVNQIDYHASITDKAGDAATGLFTALPSGSTTTTTLAVTDPEQLFRIQFAMGNGIAGCVSISDMKIVVTKANGTCLIYTNSTTPFEGYFDGNAAGGTEEDGYTTTQTAAVFSYPALSKPTNLDFSEGLKYWAPYYEKNSTPISTSDYATVNGDGTITLKKSIDEGYKEGITSQKFALPKVAAGDTVRFYFEYDWDDENGKKRDFLFRVNAFTTEEAKAPGGKSSAQKDLGCYSTNNNYLTKAPGELSDTGWRGYQIDFTVVNPDDLYTISLAYLSTNTLKIADGADCAIKFRNIRVVKVLSEGAYLDLATEEKVSADFQPFGGTEEDGIVNKAYKGAYRDYLLGSGDIRIRDIFGVTTNFVNGDFSQGFKFWFGGIYNAKFPELLGLADYATVDKETGIVKLDAAHDDGNGNKYNPQLFSLPFYIEGLKAGDVLLAAVDARNAFNKDGSNGIQIQMRELTPHSSLEYYSTLAYANSNFFDAPSETEWTTIYNNNTITVADPAHPFTLRLTKHSLDAAEFKNIRIYKIDAATGEITIVNNGYNANSNYNKDGGSAEDGMLELGSYVQNTPAVNKLTNLDLSQGLKYWAPKNGSRAFTSDVAKIEEDGSLTITKISTSEGIQTAPITFTEEYVGKEASLWFYATHQGSTFEISYYENGTRNAALARGYSGWFSITIPEVAADAKYTFEIKMPGGGSVNLKNFKLVVSVANEVGADSYYDLDGNRFMGPNLNFQPYGGTEEDGIIASSNGTGLPNAAYWHLTSTEMPANDGLANGDFSQGFKYWVYKNKDGIISDKLTLDKETGIVSYKVNNSELWAGLYSQVFSLKNSGIKVGDTVYAAVDVTNTPSSMAINLHSHTSNGEGGWINDTKNGKGSGPLADDKWATVYSEAMEVIDVNTFYYVDIQKGYEDGQGSFKNVRMLRKDRGELITMNKTTGEFEYANIKVNADGSLLDTQAYGDANYDGEVNLLDLVKMKKYAAGDTSYGIFLAAVDTDGDDILKAEDFSSVIGWILDAKK